MQTHPKKRLDIIIDATAVPDVVRLVEAGGARGYTIVPSVSGKGHRGIRMGHDIFERGQNAIVIVVADEQIAHAILEKVMGLLERYAGVAYLVDVEVARRDLF